MKKITCILITTFILIVFIFSFVGCTKNMPKEEKLDLTGFKETFIDNFDGTSLDLTKWKIDTMKNENPKLNGIRRAGYYTEDAISVKDGNLYITIDYRKDGELGEGWYTGWVETSCKAEKRNNLIKSNDYKGFSQKYGYFECRCICPPINGIWSAFWLMPDNDVTFSKLDKQGTATDGCEIDVMESPYYSKNQAVVQHVSHMDGYDSRLKSDKSPKYKIPTMYSEFHTYGVMWDENNLTFYIDGYKTYETPVKIKKNVFGTPSVPEYMILSMEVGGSSDNNGKLFPGKEKDGSKSWAGDPMFNNFDIKYDFVIDYVKVMQKI